MKTFRYALGALLTAALVAVHLAAQTESGPKAGDKVEPLKVLLAVGDDAGKEKDMAAEHAKKAAVIIFVQAEKWDRPMARFLRDLDTKLGKDRTDVPIAAIWLTEDVDKSKNYLPKAQQSLNLTQTTFAVHKGEPNGWGINSDAHMTAVVIHAGKVVASFGFTSVNETDVDAVVKKLPKKK